MLENSSLPLRSTHYMKICFTNAVYKKGLKIHHNRIRCTCGDSTRTVPNGDRFHVALKVALNRE
jgi:hypothetical protein